MAEKAFYDRIGGSYDEAKARLMSDAFIKRFVLKFRDDKSFSDMREAIKREDWEGAFPFAHTLKGVALNLSLKKLSGAAVTLTDALRPENRGALDKDKINEYLKSVEAEYEAVMNAMPLLEE